MAPTTTTSAGIAAMMLLIAAAVFDRAVPGARAIIATSTTASGTAASPTTASRWITALRRHISSVAQHRRARRPVSPGAIAAWCDAMVRRLRTGETLRLVLTHERPADAPLQEQTESLRRALGRGRSVADAVAIAAAASRHGPLDLIWSVLAIAADSGGSAAAPIDRVSSTMRLRSADAQERAAHSAQARLSAHVLTALPILVLTLLVATDPDVRFVVSRPTGWWLVGSGLVLNLCGWAWMRRIVESQHT